MDLDRASCRRLIALYAAQRALWHPAEQGDRRAKARAWSLVAVRMALPVTELKRKMESLLGSYRREKSRERRQTIAGSDGYKSRWYAYELFQFLADRQCLMCASDKENGTNAKGAESPEHQAREHELNFIKPEPGSDPEPEREPESERELEPAPVPLARLNRKRKLVRARRLARKYTRMEVSEMEPLAPASHDSYLSFGLYVASELRKYDASTLTRVKRAICDVIYSTEHDPVGGTH